MDEARRHGLLGNEYVTEEPQLKAVGQIKAAGLVFPDEAPKKSGWLPKREELDDDSFKEEEMETYELEPLEEGEIKL